VTATNFVAHTVTSQPGFCQARNAALTDTRMTLCASIMSRTCGPWPCGASGTDIGVSGISASHNKRVPHLACTGHKRSESRCNPCVFSALAPTDIFTCHTEESALLCNLSYYTGQHTSIGEPLQTVQSPVRESSTSLKHLSLFGHRQKYSFDTACSRTSADGVVGVIT
jgi:hypothetical protein